MLNWIVRCFGYNYTNNSDDSDDVYDVEECRKNLRKKVCKVCNNNHPLYYHANNDSIYNEATHCRNCKEDGMKIFIANNRMKR